MIRIKKNNNIKKYLLLKIKLKVKKEPRVRVKGNSSTKNLK